MKIIGTIIGLFLVLSGAADAASRGNFHETSIGAGAGITADEVKWGPDGSFISVETWNIGLGNTNITSNGNETSGTPPVSMSFTTLDINYSAFLNGGLETENLQGSVPLSGGYSLGSSSASVAPVTVVLTGYHYGPDGLTAVTRTVTFSGSWATTEKPARSSFSCNSSGGSLYFSFDAKSTSAAASFSGALSEGSTDHLSSATLTVWVGDSALSSFSSSKN